jgi:glycosyltransferase involved in cell wall biosynthesis
MNRAAATETTNLPLGRPRPSGTSIAPSNLRILQLHARYREPGGEDEVVAREAVALRAAGHHVVSALSANAQGRRAVRQLATYANRPSLSRRLVRLAESESIDVVHVHNTWFALSPSVLRDLRSAGFPVVATLHNYRFTCLNAGLLRDNRPCEDCVGRSPWRGVVHGCYRDSVPLSAATAVIQQLPRVKGTWTNEIDRFLALTHFVRGLMIRAGLPADRIEVLSNFTNDPGKRESPASVSRRVAYIGRLSPEKGLRLAIEAWSRVDTRDLELIVAGDGPERTALEALAPPSVRFLGRLDRDQVDGLLKTSRATIFPSVCYESQGLAALESFAAGTPVIASTLGGLGETVAPLPSTYKVEESSVEAWSSALESLLDDSSVERASSLARGLYETTYTAGTHVRALVRHYEQVLNDHARNYGNQPSAL